MPIISILRRFRANLLGKWSPVFGLAALMVAPSLSRADLFVVDSDTVGRFSSSTGAVIQTNGQNAFTTLVGATGVTVGPDARVYVGTSNPGFDPNLAVVNRYNATTGQRVGGAFITYANDPSQLSNAQGMSFGPDGNLYIADIGDDGSVKAFNANGGYLTSYLTTGGNAQAVAFNPSASGDVYVATGGTIERINLTTHADSVIVQGSSATFSDAADLAFGPDGKLYVLDPGATPRIFRYNADGTGQTVFADFSSPTFSPAIFQPTDMAFGPDGHLYVSGESLNAPTSQQGEVLRLTADGSSSTEFVTNLYTPGFLAFSDVPEPSSLSLFAGSLFFLRRPKR
ncbi:MAG: repeat containing protein [Phycisphaerales bacterium]|nr:repeat containing protein [Phycisphaerales bacterium]